MSLVRILLALALVLVAAAAVEAQTNRAPYANAGPDVTVQASPGGGDPPEIVVLSAGNQLVPPRTLDQDGDTLTCAWDVRAFSPTAAPTLVLSSSTGCDITATVPVMPPGSVTEYVYQVVLFVDDGRVVGEGLPNHQLGITCHDVVTSNQYFPARMCDTIVIRVVERTKPPVLATPPFTLSRNPIDLVADRQLDFIIQAAGVVDDYETKTVEVIFDGPTRIVFPLEKIAPGTASTQRPETSTWQTRALVSDARWMTGTYEVTVEARDAQNGLGASEYGSYQFEVTADADIQGNLDLSVIPGSLATTSVNGAECLPGVTATASYILNREVNLRLAVLFPYVADDSSVPMDVFAGEVVLLTYRVDGSGTPFVSSPVLVPYPYVISLATLAAVDQGLAIIAQDRLGNVAILCLRLVVDLDAPFYMPHIPPIAYRGVETPIAVATRERWETEATLRVDSPWGGVYEKTIDGGQSSLPTGLNWIRLPALGSDQDAWVTAFDADPTQLASMSKPCDILVDMFSPYDGYDTIVRVRDWTVRRAVKIPATTAEATPSYAIDADGDGVIQNTEPIIPGGTTQLPLPTENRCRDPFTGFPEVRAFLHEGPSQIFIWRYTGFVTGMYHTQFSIQDYATNKIARDYNYKGIVSGQTIVEVNVTLNGEFLMQQAFLDAALHRETPSMKTYLRIAGQHAPADGSKPFCPEKVEDAFLDARPILVGDTMCFFAQGVYTSTLTPPPFTILNILVEDAKENVVTMASDFVDPGDPVTLVDSRTFVASQHVFNVTVDGSLFGLINETLPSDNKRTVAVEVYAGRVDAQLGSGAASYHIRASAHGIIRLEEGAVTLRADGTMDKKYDLRLNQSILRLPGGGWVGSRYEFTVVDGGVNRTLYWDPSSNYSLKFNKACANLTDEEKVVDPAADPPKDPRCRAVTVLGKAEAPAKKSPAFLVIPTLAALILLARRR